ncbi:ferrous iron transport protein B [Porcipelethomonas sp.]|uniref:ferrous iron transport protein B n=1 Tax=Porcipelethomonas sp. TaxID=2981675 RepID=UPI003EF9B40A
MSRNLALIGNPNCGKTTLFNILTGSNQYVGNWAGVTVEKKTGKLKNSDYNVVDLPGIYALSPYSIEEKVTQEFLLKENPDAIINIIDGTNFERNMYLTVQLIELNKPMVIAVNMMDDVTAAGGNIDCEYLSELIGIPFIPISARKNENVEKVIEEIHHVINHQHKPCEIDYNRTTRNALNQIYSVIVDKDKTDSEPYPYFASKFLEGDYSVEKYLPVTDEQKNEIKKIAEDYEQRSPYQDREALVADARYHYIEELVKKAVIKKKKSDKPTVSDKIDRIVTNRILAFPIFLLIMMCMFMLTFGSVGTFLSDAIENLFNNIISPGLSSALVAVNAPSWTIRLVCDGIIGGVGGVLVFLPQIAILFLCLSLLEDSGYMARAAFLTDRFLRKLGLSGKSFIPMLMGFGCTTPAVMAARTQENTNERRMTIMLTPFMSCGAKLPIYALFAGAFFGAYKGFVVFSMYIIGLVMAIIMGAIFKKTLFKENKAPFVMELPPYRRPLVKSVLKNTWEKTKGFIIKAGTIIFAMSIVIWLLQNLTPSLHFTSDSSDSIFAMIGSAIAPIFRPLGFGTWQAAVSLLAGLVAKEAVVSTMGVLYSTESTAALTGVISGIFTPLAAFSFMIFCLLYVPCISAFATIKREMGSWKWALGIAAIQTGTAYIVSLLVYQIGSLFV